MWEIILRRLGLCSEPITTNDELSDTLFEKTRLLLYRANSLTHFNITKHMIKQYEQQMRENQCPLHMVEKYNNLITLWNQRYKMWKRG